MHKVHNHCTGIQDQEKSARLNLATTLVGVLNLVYYVYHNTIWPCHLQQARHVCEWRSRYQMLVLQYISPRGRVESAWPEGDPSSFPNIDIQGARAGPAGAGAGAGPAGAGAGAGNGNGQRDKIACTRNYFYFVVRKDISRSRFSFLFLLVFLGREKTWTLEMKRVPT